MVEQVNITMIGASSTGKTCYLAAMFSEMGFGINGFTFIPEDFDKQLCLEALWGKICEERKWPGGTLEGSHYVFDVSYSLKQILKIKFLDYRGGVLGESSESTDSQQGEVFNAINDSSALIITLSYKLIIEGINKKQKSLSILRRYITLLQKYRKKNGNQVPVVFLLTMADCYKNGELKQAYEFIQNIFNICFQSDAEWLVMIIPVSLGDLGLPSDEHNTVIEGEVAPVNLHLPVLFCVYTYMTKILEHSISELNYFKGRLSSSVDGLRDAEKKNWLNRFFNHEERVELKGEIRDFESQITESSDKIGSMEKELDKIVDELYHENESGERPCKIFFDGEELERE